MTRWIALLRGVNVGGITIRSADLAAVFRELGMDAVRTVLASGNVDFTAPDEVAALELKARIEAALGERFGYTAWIVLLPHAQLAAIIAGYPFAEDPEHHAYVVLASDAAALEELAAAPEEPVALGEGVLYWRGLKGTSTTSPFAKKLAAARYKASTTTRNIRTLRKLV